ncbi:hypothetical protein [Helicobacter saguini]|nr:hypothetical protein [Helicobacter saguini]
MSVKGRRVKIRASENFPVEFAIDSMEWIALVSPYNDVIIIKH